MKPNAVTASLAAPLALVLALVLLAHWIGLGWLREQLPERQPLRPMAEPLFTRIIVPTRTATAVRTRAVKPKRVRAPARKAAVATLAPAAPNEVAPAAPLTPASAGLAYASEPAPVETATQAGADAPVAPEAPAAAAATATSAAPGSGAAADDWPPGTRLSYDLKGYYRGDLYGSARVQWQREQSRYQVRVDLRMALVLQVRLISQGETSANGLRPSAYEEQFFGAIRRLAFDAGQVRFPNGSLLAQPPALQDSASQLVELSHRFSSGREALQVGRAVQLWLARPQGLALWTYDVVEEETLQIPAFGPVQAFHLRPRQISNPSGPITAEIWLAPSLHYLPVRVRIALGGENYVDLLVDRIEQGAAPALVQARAWIEQR